MIGPTRKNAAVGLTMARAIATGGACYPIRAC